MIGLLLCRSMDGWIDRPAITDSQNRQRWQNITDEYKQRSATELYDRFVHQVMKGKTIEFNPDVFFKIANLMGPLYFKSDEEKIDIIKNSSLEGSNDPEALRRFEEGIEDLYPQPLCKVDGDVWSVKAFSRELDLHPLVFRKQKMKKKSLDRSSNLLLWI